MRLTDLPGITLQDDEPVFAEPWEAQAFALIVHLHERGAFTWAEWADALSSEIHGGQTLAYYQHWLKALETLVAAKGLTSASALTARKQDWLDAAARTPHGQPITL
ncbi:nitrile hydratase accessory protein [Pontivivens insulae]|nr:nitrile hydratase accessory protein [Pontivivens insulae]